MIDLTVIFPVYNERETIKKLLDVWKRTLDDLGIQYYFLICEDGSTDGTSEFLRSIKGDYPLTLNQKKTRRGYGKAIIDAISSAESHYIACVDSDGQYSASDFKKMWMKRESASVMRGIRKKRKDTSIRKLFSYAFKIWFFMLFSSWIVDPSSSFILFKRKDVVRYIRYLLLMQEGFWWGFSGLCVRKKIPFVNIPIHHNKRISGKTRVYTLKKILPIAIKNVTNLWRLRHMV